MHMWVDSIPHRNSKHTPMSTLQPPTLSNQCATNDQPGLLQQAFLIKGSQVDGRVIPRHRRMIPGHKGQQVAVRADGRAAVEVVAGRQLSDGTSFKVWSTPRDRHSHIHVHTHRCQNMKQCLLEVFACCCRAYTNIQELGLCASCSAASAQGEQHPVG